MRCVLFGPRAWRALSVLILVVVLAGMARVGTAAAPAAPSAAAGPSFVTATGYCADAEERAFLALINTYRAQNGRAPLRLTKTLAAAADHHSRDMAANNYLGHTLSTGVTWSQNIRNHGYTYSTYRAENIAAGNATASATFTQWKNSAGHNTNMLNANYAAIGIGRSYNASATYKWYWTTTFGGYQDAAVTCST